MGFRATCIAMMLMILSPHMATAAQAQPGAIFSSDSAVVLIGEPIVLTLTVSVPTNASVTLPDETADWEGFEVQAILDTTTELTPDSQIVRRQYQVVLWRVGDFSTPPFTVSYQLSGESGSRVLVVQPTFFLVSSVLRPGDLIPRPYLPPISLFFVPLWWIPVGIVTALVALIVSYSTSQWFGNRFLVRRPRNRTSAQIAKRRLNRIATDNRSDVRETYMRVTLVLREYIERRFNIPATQMATEELLDEMRQQRVQPAILQQLTAMLEAADDARFDQLEPQRNEIKILVGQAVRWIEQVTFTLGEEVL